MTVDSGWERVRVVFHEALEQPPEARRAFLDAACQGDDVLRREVMSLLGAHAAAGGFLEQPAVHLERAAASDTARPVLQAGDHIGNFEVVGPLGTGGMGEVYRARDLRLGRDIALKLLPPAFAADPQRLARFERESRILGSLNHPNIATIHSVEHVDGLHLLVLELVEGPTLADRLKTGRLAAAEALDVARQLAEALETAHERGVVHRDLKPANVALSASGRVTLLDFGLAKDRALPDAEAAMTPEAARTTGGMILGTCGYMSPEQARGQPVDRRADVWAFGCILFELLTGERAFPGATPSDTIAAVLEREPPWSALPEGLPSRVRRLLRRCLEKDPHRRLHDIADARIEVEEALGPETDDPSATGPVPDRRRALTRAGLAALLLASGVGVGWWVRGGWPEERLTAPARFTWTVPAGLRLGSPPTVSPDGRHIAFTASGDGGPPRLYVWPLSALEPSAVPRTEGASQPFWSPDGQKLAYFAGGKLFRIAREGGAPVEICSAGNPRGGTWGRSGIIVFSPASIYSGLSRVSADGGPVEPVTRVDMARGDNAHRWPVFLPDGTHFLYFVRSIAAERRGVYLGSIDGAASPATPILFRSESEAVYAPLDGRGRGVLLSVANGHIDVHPFDSRRRLLTGDPAVIPLPAGTNTPHHACTLSASADVLAHLSSALPYGQRLVSVAIAGGDRRLHVERGIVSWPRVSPDGRRLVSHRVHPLTGSPDLWVEDLARGTSVRVNQEGTSTQHPVWSPDGTRLAYVAGTLREPVLTIAAADGAGPVSTLPCPRARCEPSDWTRDGRWLVVNALDRGLADVWLLPVAGDGTPRPLLTQSFVERDARCSPDGRLLAYVSEEAGRPEISVRTLEGIARRAVVSVGGGTQPVWSLQGTALFFVDPGGSLRKASVRHGAGQLVVGPALPLNVPAIGTGHYGTQYDLAPDGRRLYFLEREPGDPPREVGVILGWRSLLVGMR